MMTPELRVSPELSPKSLRFRAVRHQDTVYVSVYGGAGGTSLGVLVLPPCYFEDLFHFVISDEDRLCFAANPIPEFVDQTGVCHARGHREKEKS